MKKYFKSLLPTAIGLAVGLLSLTANAEFNLDKYRVVLDDSERRTDLKVYNTSDDFNSIRVQVVDMQMNENGEIVPAEDYAYSAKKMVRIGPRMAKNITPHTYQKFRVRARSGQEPGEFRTHILIEELLPPYEGEAKGMVIRPNLRMIIPVFIQRGKVDVSVTAADFDFSPTDNTLSFALKRQGNGSAFGNIVIENTQGDVVYRKHNIGIYRELEQRLFSVTLPPEVNSVDNFVFKFLEPDSEKMIFQQSF